MKKGILSMAAVSALVMGTWSLGIGDCDAGVPRMMNYQGKLTDGSGQLVSNGQYGMKFAMYDAETGGTQEWTETWDSSTSRVQVTNGLFNVLLGSTTALGLDFGENYWLEIQVEDGGTYETLLPRQQLVSAGYAFRAEKVTDGAITDASISPSAAIADTKLATISTAGKVSGSAVSGTLAAVNGSAVTDLNGGNITSGSVSATCIEDKFLRNDANDQTSGKLTCAGLDTGSSNIVTLGNVGLFDRNNHLLQG